MSLTNKELQSLLNTWKDFGRGEALEEAAEIAESYPEWSNEYTKMHSEVMGFGGLVAKKIRELKK